MKPSKINMNAINFNPTTRNAIHKGAVRLRVKLAKMEMDYKRSLRPISRLFW